MGDAEKIAELQRQIDELKAGQAQPKGGWIEPRPMARDFSLLDRTAGASMPPSATRAMTDAIPEMVLADIRSDALRRSPAAGPVSIVAAPSPREPMPKSAGRGWQDEKPARQPPGIGLIDQITERFAGPPHGPKPKAEPTAVGEEES